MSSLRFDLVFFPVNPADPVILSRSSMATTAIRTEAIDRPLEAAAGEAARGFSDSAAAGARRPAAGVSRQRRQHAAAAAGDRRAAARVRARLRQRPPRHPHAQRAEHRAVRRGPREGAGLHRRQARPRSDLHAGHDGEHQHGGPQLGRREPAAPATRSLLTDDGASFEPRALAAARRADRRRAAAHPDHATTGGSCWTSFDRLLTGEDEARGRGVGVEHAGHDQPGRRDRAAGACGRGAGAGRCGAKRAASARPTCGARAPTSWPSAATRCSAPRASACSTAARSCSTRCRRFWAAAA